MGRVLASQMPIALVWTFGLPSGAYAQSTVPLTAQPGFLSTAVFLVLCLIAVVSGLFLLHHRRVIAELRREAKDETARFRKQYAALKAVELGETRLKAILDSIADGLVTFDHQGKILSVNCATREMFGYRSEEILGEDLAIFKFDIAPGELIARISQLTSELSIKQNLKAWRANGEQFDVDATLSKITQANTSFFIAALKDLSAEKAVQEQFKEFETRLLDAIDALPDGFALYSPDDRLEICNQRYRDFYATSADLLVPGNSFEYIIREGARRGQYVVPDDDIDAWVEDRLELHRNPKDPMEQHLDDGRWLRAFEHRTADGRTVGFRIDITELKVREAALRDSESQLRATISAALDGIVIMDAQGAVVEFNPAAEAIFGYQRRAMVGQNMAKLIIPERHREAHANGLDTFTQTGLGPVLGQRIEIEGLKKDGSEVLLELAINVSKGGEDPIFIGYMRDITDEKAREAALETALEKARVAGQAKASFLAMMSHEIRTPLNAVLGILNLLRETQLDSGQSRYISTARDSAEALLQIINDILDFSKLEAGKLGLEDGAFELRPAVNSVWDLMAPHAKEKGLELRVRIAAETPQVLRSDAGRIRQVLLNLVGNAVKFTEQGSVSIDVAPLEVTDEKALVRFSVQDTGIGIPKDKLSLLFSEFTTLDSSYSRRHEGSGLGLAISREIVELMGGKIEVSSIQGEGTTFWFDLSLARADSTQLAPLTHELSSVDLERLSGARILIAEDNMTNQMVIADTVQRLGCQVDCVGTGREAINRLGVSRYDAILMDISMPEMDGVEATRLIRKSSYPYSDIPIIALTAHVSLEDQKHVRKAGMNAFLSKPVVRNQLIATLASILPDASYERKRSEPYQSAILDEVVLNKLLSGLSLPVRDAVVDQFAKDIQVTTRNLISGFNARDYAEVQRACHILKSVSATFGARELGRITDVISQIDADPDYKALQTDIDDLRQIAATTLDAVRQFFDKTAQACPEIEAG
ncbi:MAG: PAS domain S-box protein [Stappiaceae bacterium]